MSALLAMETIFEALDVAVAGLLVVPVLTAAMRAIEVGRSLSLMGRRPIAYHRAVFATLFGGYPAPDATSPPAPGPELDAAVRGVLAEQANAGIGLLTDGNLRMPDPIAAFTAALADVRDGQAGQVSWSGPITLGGWSFAARAAGEVAGGLPVKQCLPGPYTLGRRLFADDARRPALTLDLADALAKELEALAGAGCPFIQVDEDDAVAIGADESEQALFRQAHDRMLGGLPSQRPHLSLAICGGDADSAGNETIFSAPYDSHLFDLIAGPENWRLIRWAPPERGIVVGVVDARSPKLDKLELVVWAVGYAASTGGRGEARIGIAPSGNLAGLPADAARQKIELLGRVAELFAKRDTEPIAASLDPRAVDTRSAALGRWTSPRDRRPSR